MDSGAIKRVIDAVATRYAAVPSDGEIERAREEFDAARGKVYVDDELHDAHMALFVEWYVLERPLPDGQTPAELALALKPTEDAEILLALTRSQRSLFEVARPGQADVLLLDLLYGGLWHVDLDSPGSAMEPGDIFEARLIPWQGQVRLGPYTCYHPASARELILAMLETARAASPAGAPDLAVTSALAEMRLRYSRFRNIAVEHIYTTTPFSQEATP